MKTVKASYALLIAVGLLMTGLLSNVMAATQSWKGAINGVWATAATDPTATNWTGNVTWTNGNDALFPVGGTSIATISGAVTARSVTSSGGANLIVTNGVLNLGVGGFNNLANNDNFKIYSDVNLTTAQSWTANRKIFVYGPMSGAADITISGSGNYPATLAGSNTFSGSVTLLNGATLDLDFGTHNNQKLDPSGGLIVNDGGKVQWYGGSTVFSQAINGVTVGGVGHLVLNRSGQNNVLKLGTISRSGYTTVNFSQTDAALLSNVNQNGILGCWAIQGAGWAYNKTGAADGAVGSNSATTDNNPLTGWLATENVNHNNTLANPVTSRTINSLRMGGPASLDLSGATLTLASGGLMSANSNPTISNGYLQSGLASGEVFAWTIGQDLTLTVVIQNNGTTTNVLVKAGGKTLILANANTYSGSTLVNEGTLQIGNGGAAGDISNSSGVILAGGNLVFNRSDAYAFTPPVSSSKGGTITRNAGTGALTMGAIMSNGTLADNSTNGSSAPTTINQSGTGLTIGTINGASGSVINFVGSGSTTISGAMQAPGQLVRISGGTVTNLNGRDTRVNLQVDGGLFVCTGDRLGMNAQNTDQSLAVNGGQVNVTGNYGIRLNGDNGVGSSGNTRTVTATQTSGTVIITSGEGLQLGNITGGTTTYLLSGGILNPQGGNAVRIGNVTSGAGVSSFTLSGSGKLLAAGTIAGSQGAGAIQNFIFNGGTLAANAVDMTKLTASGATTGSAVALQNNGGTLAPGDIGTAGKTTVTGNYTVNSAAASLAIDIGGTTQATGFQTGTYDLVAVSGTAVLDGYLRVSFINNYQPSASDTFDVLTGTAVSGSFVNVVGGKVLTQDGRYVFDVTVAATKVTLSNPQSNEWVGGTSGDWATAGNWGASVVPDTADEGAYLGTLGQTRALALGASSISLMGLTLDAQSSPYNVTGTGLLTFSNPSGITLSVLSGESTLDVPVTLNQAGTVQIANYSRGIPGLNKGTTTPFGNYNNEPSSTVIELYSQYKSIWYGVWPTQNTVYVYKGYVWNNSLTNETWRFVAMFDDGVNLRINGSDVLSVPYNTTMTNTATLLPGANAFDARFSNNAGNGGWMGGLGLKYDPTGGTTWKELVENGSDLLFTASTTPVLGKLILSKTVTGQDLAVTGGGELTLSGNNNILSNVTVNTGSTLIIGGSATFSGLSVAAACTAKIETGTLTLNSDLVLAAGAIFDFRSISATLRVPGTSDTAMRARITAGEFSVKGVVTTSTADFVIRTGGGYVSIAPAMPGTIILIK